MSSLFDSAQSLKDIAGLYRADEALCLERLFAPASLNNTERPRAVARATHWIEEIRRTHRPAANVNDLLSRFGLTSQEGLALMCLAEALLRIPDPATADALIRDKLNETHWNEALGQDSSWALNATGWALSITGKIIHLEDPTKHSPGAALGKLISRLGQPVIREAIKTAMEWLANQFVIGETIGEALTRAQPLMEAGHWYSFDMLGEGARTADDAERYYRSYIDAIDAIGGFQARHKFTKPSGISVKLSALHPKYEMVQRERVMKEMLPRVITLVELAASYDIPLTIDAEEADRLQLSLEVSEELLKKAQLGHWEGLGFAVQAYQKRAPLVIDFFVGLAEAYKKKLSIRLVKGAYWDSEIKRAQERGWDDFPVFTRKASTDVSYLACARRMLEAGASIRPVFGTHNALTIAHILELSQNPNLIEFQHLYGMGDELYNLMQKEGFSTCIYAPVGDHDVLLGYLVRRILENGANSSFVHRLLDRNVSISDLTSDPVEEVRSQKEWRHPLIKQPPDLYKPERLNSRGLDLTDPYQSQPLLASLEKFRGQKYSAASIVNGRKLEAMLPEEAVNQAFEVARYGYKEWSNWSVDKRAASLEKLAELLEEHHAEMMALLIREGGKTVTDALAEVREAVDFCRYYAARARQDLVTSDLPGPVGEQNQLHLLGRGIFVTISPWNFPLAIFLGQITAALVAGNAVIAKPAPQTPLISGRVAELIYESGIPPSAFGLLNGGADLGAMIIRHPHVAGVAFTGSTAAARLINVALANKAGSIVPFIAETGGQNAMIVDGSALPEQVVDDVIISAFRSAGQRCSALRVLCLPDTIADKILTMLKGAMRELRIGEPFRLDVEVGPVIDKAAQARLLDHVVKLKDEAKEIFTCLLPAICLQGTYVAPQAWEIPSLGWLKGEVFGPILHVVRYPVAKLDDLLSEINATGFGLTGGIHSRIEGTVRHVERELRVGNFYINRSMIGAVVGVQPFGGEGLSGTGPKAGGPHYLPRFAIERVTSNNYTASGGNASLMIATSK